MRMYEMFMGPLEVSKPWSTRGIAGIKRFLDRIWRISQRKLTDEEPPRQLAKLLHQTIRKVSRDTETLQFNTAIAQMMIFVSEVGKLGRIHRQLWRPFVLLLAPYAPHLSEELWEKLGEQPSLAYRSFPTWDEDLAREEVVTVVFQIDGKIRGRQELPAGLSREELEQKALDHPRIRELLRGKKTRKMIVVPDKLVNIVVRG
jgi:leucyl-tRNA synthetase